MRDADVENELERRSFLNYRIEVIKWERFNRSLDRNLYGKRQGFSIASVASKDVNSVLRWSMFLKMNSTGNVRLKLPPIQGNFIGSNEESNKKSSLGTLTVKKTTGNFDDLAELQTREDLKIYNENFSLSHIYPVLPPIGGKTNYSKAIPQPGADSTIIPRAPSRSITIKKNKNRRPRVKKPSFPGEIDPKVSSDLYEPIDARANKILKEDTSSDGLDGNANDFIVTIPEKAPSDLSSTNTVYSKVLTEDASENGNEISDETLMPEAILTDLSEAATSGANEDNIGINGLASSRINLIPEELIAYADVYPSSPPSNERRAKLMVQRIRQELSKENAHRLTYFEEMGSRRRNATCPELDDVLCNAVEILKDIFLKKTMEELCMMW